MEPVFIDVGPSGWDLGNLMPHRVGIVALERGTTTAAAGRLDLERISQPLGWDEGTGVAGMSGAGGRDPIRPTAPGTGLLIWSFETVLPASGRVFPATHRRTASDP